MTASLMRLPRRPRAAVLLVASLALVATTQLAAALQSPTASIPGAAVDPGLGPAVAPDAPTIQLVELKSIDRSIATWAANLSAEPKDFLSATNLALLLEGRARVSGDVGDAVRAREAAARALSVEPTHLPARLLHARLQLTLHDFRAALVEAESIDRTVADQPAVLAVIGDALLELGDVAGAEARYRRLAAIAPGPAVTARLARLDFLRGDPAAAVAGAEAAFRAAEAEGQVGSALSWYAYLAGTLGLAAGAPESAAGWYDRALGAWPGSFLALAGRARADAALGRVDEAIAGFERAIAIAPRPDALAALGDLYALRGEDRRADALYETVLAVARLGAVGADDGPAAGPGRPEVPVDDRQLAMFLVNHGLDPGAALEMAEAGLQARRDVYGYDAYAWALLANGRLPEAEEAMQQALALGTRDAMLLFHAGMIAAAGGDERRAEALLRESLAIRGALDPLTAARAATTLQQLGAER